MTAASQRLRLSRHIVRAAIIEFLRGPRLACFKYPPRPPPRGPPWFILISSRGR
jgi:hypothetical protein